MDQTTHRIFIKTIETFFPRELCGEMEGYPNFQTDYAPNGILHRGTGLNTDFVCGKLKDAAESGEYVVRCIQMPSLYLSDWRSGTNSPHERNYIITGFWFMIYNKHRIIVCKHPDLYYERSGSGWTGPWSATSPGRPIWMFIDLPEGLVDNDYRLFDFITQDYVSRFSKDPQNVRPVHPKITKAMQFPSCIISNNIIQLASAETLITTYRNLLQTINATVPQQQRIARRRQRSVQQSSGRIERSLDKIRGEFQHLEAELMKLRELSSGISTDRSLTIRQDRQLDVAMPSASSQNKN
jgi:hypothetical protein